MTRHILDTPFLLCHLVTQIVANPPPLECHVLFKWPLYNKTFTIINVVLQFYNQIKIIKKSALIDQFSEELLLAFTFGKRLWKLDRQKTYSRALPNWKFSLRALTYSNLDNRRFWALHNGVNVVTKLLTPSLQGSDVILRRNISQGYQIWKWEIGQSICRNWP